MDKEITVNMTVTIPKQRISDLLCTAFETGLGWGCWFHKYAHLLMDEEEFEEWREAGGKYPWQLPLMGHTVDVLADSPDGRGKKWYALSGAKVAAGLQRMAQDYPRHFADFLQEENEDAITGDVFLQLALFGEVVYG